ncbi:CaiB/BaiF CoA transferase family protein [Acidocella facilis]|uniref:CaiB/BaiF CoA transferase family protein n=1 Tax=Acidocella facilis TaxID=525 RepID=UPI001F1A64B6|nr:CoA transferase [Acidocella facilis]
MEDQPLTAALRGLRIIDTTHVLAGPFATYQLAVLGAEVIKVESPHDPDQARWQGVDRNLNNAGMGTSYLAQASNKKSVCLDLKTIEGCEILKRLVETADVFVENYRPGALEALGLGYNAFSNLNPRLIYCSISAFGQTGQRREETAYDGVIQAFSGMMAMTGTSAGGPLKCGAPVVDYATGTTAAFAIAAALFQRERAGGRGQFIDVSMLDVATMLCSPYVTAHFWNSSIPKLKGNTYPFATIGCYETEDGLLMLSASNLRQQARLWLALGRPDQIKSDNNQRLDSHGQEQAVLAEIFLARPADEWEFFLKEHRVPAARVRGLEESLKDLQQLERGVLQRHSAAGTAFENLTVPVAAFSMSESVPGLTAPPQEAGAQTGEVLRALGYTEGQIAALREARVINA